MKLHRRLTVALACAAISAATGQAAAATVMATMTNVRMELVDLDPNDGITPAIAKSHTVGSDVAILWAETDGAWWWYHGYPTSAVGPVVAISGSSMASLSMGAGNPFGASSVNAQASGEGKWAKANGTFYDLAIALTPHTEIRLMADVSVTVSGLAGETATVDIGIKKGPYPAGSTPTFEYSNLSWSLDAQGNSFTGTSSVMLTLGNYGANPPPIGSTSGLTEVMFYANAYVSSIAAPVPEPATAGLMLAGLAGLGALARRRR